MSGPIMAIMLGAKQTPISKKSLKVVLTVFVFFLFHFDKNKVFFQL